MACQKNSHNNFTLSMGMSFLTCSNKPAILIFVENKAEAIRFSPYMAFVLLRFMRNQSSG